MQAKRRQQIEAVDAALSFLYDRFPALSQLNASEVADVDSDEELKEKAERAHSRVLIAINDTIRDIHYGDIGPFDMPAAVSSTREELPAPLKTVLDDLRKEHQTRQFWRNMGLTAAEILLAFVPIIGPALALGVGAANLAVQGEELLDQMQMAEAGANPLENPLGAEGPSGFQQAMFAVTAILTAVGAGGVAMQLRGGKAAASAIDEAAEALGREAGEGLGRQAGQTADAVGDAVGGAAKAEPKAVIDYTKPLSSAGYRSSGAKNPVGERVDVYEGNIPGVSEPVAIKVYEAGKFDKFQEDLAGAAAAAKTGRAAKFYGEVPAGNGKKAFAMEKVKGGMTDNGSTAPVNSPEWLAAENEASFYRQRVSSQTLADLEEYRKKLLAGGHYYKGEVQGLVTSDGRWVAIDFQGIRKLPPKTARAAYDKALTDNKSNFAAESGILKKILQANSSNP